MHSVMHLAAAGAKVYLTARSESNAKAAVERIISKKPELSKDRLRWLRMDLGDTRSILDAIKELRSKEGKVDILGALSFANCMHC